MNEMIRAAAPSIGKTRPIAAFMDMKKLSEEEIKGSKIPLTLSGGYLMYRDLIMKSRFRDRISFLVNNPHLAETNLPGNEKPCCWGTVSYVLCANQKVRDIWVKNGHRLDDHANALGDYVVLPENHALGYIGREPMELFLTTLKETSAEEDSVISFFWQNKNNEGFTGFGVGHSGIYLGRYGGSEIMFEQRELGGRFGFRSVKDFIYSLSDESRSNLKIKYHNPAA